MEQYAEAKPLHESFYYVSSSWPESLSYQTDRRDADTNSEILKTGSSSTSEHCVLEFLSSRLQILMDRLLDVYSVMSVERRFGSVLLDTM
ncbi:LOW QUALITY PROTEIN: hypothetical protein ACHAWO_001514 [Cyclotella atomus]|uniref:Uncharacterized protein n=1 Tax=Cyclotella atomus TaxID=382360 RepID=A0ABD3NQ36_9STRA